MMNYSQQAAKENPFANLSPDEAKKMYVYLTMIATPRMSDSEIYRHYGFILAKVLPNDRFGLDIGERTMLMMKVMQEIQGQASGMEEPHQNAPTTQTKPTSSGCLVPIIALLSVATLAFMGCGPKEPSTAEIERGVVNSFRHETGITSGKISAKATKIGNGRWDVRIIGERYDGERRTLNATAVMDKNGDIHYYTE